MNFLSAHATHPRWDMAGVMFAALFTARGRIGPLFTPTPLLNIPGSGTLAPAAPAAPGAATTAGGMP